jgi:hypothetical protein
MPFKEGLQEMPGRIADAPADGIEWGISPTSKIIAIESLMSSFPAAIWISLTHSSSRSPIKPYPILGEVGINEQKATKTRCSKSFVDRQWAYW